MQHYIPTERIPYCGITETLSASAFLAHAAPKLTPRQRYEALVELLPAWRRPIERVRFVAVKVWES